MSPAIVADSIVNMCGAIGLGVAMLTLRRRDAHSPQTRRLLFALGLVAVLFFVRSAAWWSGSDVLDRLSLVPAALIPFGTVIVTEGMLRRHAPRPVKIAAVTGGVLLGVGALVGSGVFVVAHGVALMLFQLAGFAVCALLLVRRDPATLMASENRSIGRLAVGALVVMPFVVTDFRVLLPDIPVRLGALGALLVISVLLITGGGAETRRQGLLLTALRLVSSGLLGAAAAFLTPEVDGAQVVRFCAVAISGVLAIALMVDALRSLFESHAPGLLNSVAASAAQSRDGLIAELGRHPLFASARRLREGDLADYDPPLLRTLLARQQLLRRADAPWGLPQTDPAVERVVSLLAAHSATHLIVLSHDPVDVMVLAVPVVSADPATETALALVGRLLVLAPEQA
ncbi:MAG: hypothetical protein AB1586_26180 [Pseudomonadota bacterium]